MVKISCLSEVEGVIVHKINLDGICPYSGNPLHGSTISLAYRPKGAAYPLEWLEELIRKYRSGNSDQSIRNIEEMIQDLAIKAAKNLGVRVRVRADLKVTPPQGGNAQDLFITARASPLE